MASMEATWDLRKERANIAKHGVDFADAAVALEDEYALSAAIFENDEERFKTLAASPISGVLLIVHTENDGETIRIVSARKADRAERLRHYKGLALDD